MPILPPKKLISPSVSILEKAGRVQSFNSVMKQNGSKKKKKKKRQPLVLTFLNRGGIAEESEIECDAEVGSAAIERDSSGSKIKMDKQTTIWTAELCCGKPRACTNMTLK